MTLEEFKATLTALPPGKAAHVPYEIYEAFFPPGEPDQGAREAAYNFAKACGCIIDNRAKGVACYDPGYTFVEKLQTVSTKFRLQQAAKDSSIDFMRHYYDIYALLRRPEVQAFIGTDA